MFHLQLSLNSGRALELLLETHKPFSLLLSIIKTQCLAQLKTKLCNSQSAITKSSSQDSSPNSHSQSENVLEVHTQLKESDTQPLILISPSDHHVEGIESVTTTCIHCCDPYVVSGWCQLINNLFQAFPELIGSYIHNYCIVTSLTR